MNEPLIEKDDIRVVFVGGMAVIGEYEKREEACYLKKPRVVQLIQNQDGRQGIILAKFVFEPDEINLTEGSFKIHSIEAMAHYKSAVTGLAIPKGGVA